MIKTTLLVAMMMMMMGMMMMRMMMMMMVMMMMMMMTIMGVRLLPQKCLHWHLLRRGCGLYWTQPTE